MLHLRSTQLRAGLCAVLVVLAAAFAAAPATAKPKQPGQGLSITKSSFGTVDGTAADKYTLSNAHRMSVSILTYCVIIQSLSVSDNRAASPT